ncbi:TetR/AcrR family transcriptional regulator [Saccharomonospora sp. NPDC006951]
MSGKPVDGRSLRYRHRRDELLNLVTGYVLEHGIGGLSMRPLATAVGVSHGTLLHHFGSKEKLITDVVAGLRNRLADEAGMADTSVAAPGVGGLTAWWAKSTMPRHLPVYRVLFEVYTQAVREPERYERYLREAVAGAHAVIEELVVAEGCPAEEAKEVASMVVAQARGLQLELLATGDHERVDRAFALFVDMVTGVVRARRREQGANSI